MARSTTSNGLLTMASTNGDRYISKTITQRLRQLILLVAIGDRNMSKRKKRLISSGSPFEEKIGYSRAVCDGKWVFVAGTTGFNYDTMEISDDVVVQCRQTLKNIDKVLRDAGSGFADVVRVIYIFPDSNDFEKCWPVLHEYFADVRPASTMYSAGLADSRMKVEIEVTARKS